MRCLKSAMLRATRYWLGLKLYTCSMPLVFVTCQVNICWWWYHYLLPLVIRWNMLLLNVRNNNITIKQRLVFLCDTRYLREVLRSCINLISGDIMEFEYMDGGSQLEQWAYCGIGSLVVDRDRWREPCGMTLWVIWFGVEMRQLPAGEASANCNSHWTDGYYLSRLWMHKMLRSIMLRRLGPIRQCVHLSIHAFGASEFRTSTPPHPQFRSIPPGSQTTVSPHSPTTAIRLQVTGTPYLHASTFLMSAAHLQSFILPYLFTSLSTRLQAASIPYLMHSASPLAPLSALQRLQQTEQHITQHLRDLYKSPAFKVAYIASPHASTSPSPPTASSKQQTARHLYHVLLFQQTNPTIHSL